MKYSIPFIIILSLIIMQKLWTQTQEKFTDDLLLKIKVPKGYVVEVFAKELDAPRMMVEDDGGNIYVSRPSTGEILILKDTDHDGSADDKQIFLRGYEKVNGLAIDGSKLYFSALKKVYSVDLKDKTKIKTLTENLPDEGFDQKRSLAIGPDHMLYISIPTIQKINLNGLGMTPFAKGLHNTVGFDWHPDSHVLYGMDQSTAKLNRIVEGKDYDREPPVLTYNAHSKPIGFKFYNGSMFPKSKGSAFVAFHEGYNVSKIIFKDGKPQKFETFMSGFFNKKTHSQFGHPTGLLVLKDGSLLVSDDSGGLIYHVYYDNTP